MLKNLVAVSKIELTVAIRAKILELDDELAAKFDPSGEWYIAEETYIIRRRDFWRSHLLRIEKMEGSENQMILVDPHFISELNIANEDFQQYQFYS